MIRFNVEVLARVWADLEALRLVLMAGGAETASLSESNLNFVRQRVEAVSTYCHTIGFFNPQMHCQRIMSRLSIEPLPNSEEVRFLLTELRNRVEDEARIRYFMLIPLEKAPRYFGENLFGPEVAAAFPEASLDIDEAGKCFAAGRNTASVLHLMRAAEVALKEIVRLVGSDPTRFPNWELLSREVERAVSEIEHDLKLNAANPQRRWRGDDAQFLAGVARDFRSLKVALRNPSMHAERSYSESEADDVYQSLRLLMRSIAARVTEPPAATNSA
jgi:hypothetical protein